LSPHAALSLLKEGKFPNENEEIDQGKQQKNSPIENSI
jgi:hypothetical protein